MSTSEPNRGQSQGQPRPDPQSGQRKDGASCTVDSRLNYSVGAVSVAAGAALIWFGWNYLSG